MDRKHILVVDDDPKVRQLLRRCFEQDGYGVSEAANGSQLQARLESGHVDLITLDLNLGGEDGLSIARGLRATHDIPIVMITGKGDTIDTIVGLEVGADDYIAKPFHVREVLARIRSVLRRASEPGAGRQERQASPDDAVYRFDDWVLDATRFELRDARGDVHPLTTGEFRLLEALARHANKVLSRDQIMDLLKGHDSGPFDRSVDNQIARLRKKIEPDPARPRLIKTVRGMGYCLTADVKRG